MTKFLIAAAMPLAMLGSAALAQSSAGTGTSSGTGTMSPSSGSSPTTMPSTDPYGGASTSSPTTPGSADRTMQRTTPQSGSMSGSTAGSMASTDATQSSNSTAAVDAAITDGFPRYDKDGSGALSEAEFKSWVSDLKSQEMTAMGKAKDAAAVRTYAGTAWTAADRNSDKSVTRDELRTFLGG